MTVDLDEHRTIATGRSWRDLPPNPPLESRPMAPSPPPAASPTGSPRSGVGRRVIVLGLVALVAGLAVGIWSPWRSDDSSSQSAAAPATTSTSPEGIEALPDTIVPDVPPELFTEPQPQDQFDPFGLLDQLPPFEGLPGIQNDLALIRLGPLPDGYRSIGSLVTSSGEDVRHQIRLLGPEGLATIWAERDPPVTLPEAGTPVDIGGIEGRLVEGSTNTVTWQLGDVIITAHAPSEVGVDTLLAIAEAVEVAE